MQPEIVVQAGHTLGIVDIAFSPDNQFIASAASDETVRLWDLRVGCEFRVLAGHVGPVYAVRYAPGGDYLVSGGFDKVPIVWNLASGKPERRLGRLSRPVRTFAFDRTGTRLLVVSEMYRDKAELAVWNTADWSLVQRLSVSGDKGQMSQCVALSPDGATLAAVFPAPWRIVLFDVASGKDCGPLDAGGAAAGGDSVRALGDLVFSAAGDALGRVSAVRRPEWIALDASRGAAPRTIATGMQDVIGAKRLADGSLLLLGEDRFEHWDATASHRLAQGNGAIDTMSGDGRLAATTRGRVLVVSDAASGECIYELGQRPNTPVTLGNLGRHYAVAANPVYPMVVASAPDGCVRLWDFRAGRGPTIFKASDGAIENLAFSPDGQMLAAAAAPIRVWDAWTGALIGEAGTDDHITHVAFSNDASVLAALGPQALTLVHLAHSEVRRYPLALVRDPAGLVYERGTDSLFIAAQDGQFFMFRPEDLEDQGRHEGESGAQQARRPPIGALADSPGGLAVIYSQRRWIEGLLSSLADTTEPAPQSAVACLRPGTTEPVTLTGGAPYAVAAAVSPDGRAIAIACAGGEVNLWDDAGKDPPHAWMAHPGAATSVAWTSDGRFLVSTGMDGAVRLWRADTRALAATLVSINDTDYVVVAADGTYTATRGGLAGVVFRIEGRAVPFDQFDLRLNRPDLVLAGLGYAYDDLIDTLALAHRRRARRIGVRPPAPGSPLQLPRLALRSPPPPLASQDACCVVRVRADAAQFPLSRLLVVVNDVPYPDSHGIVLDPPVSEAERELAIPLGSGANRIEISALDSSGTESLREVIRTRRPGGGGRLFILSVGVSRYRDASLCLQYAAKDARDMADALRRCQTHFADVSTQLLVDDQATRAALLDSAAFLRQARVDDQVVVFLAGHGELLDGEFYFLPYDFDAAHPLATGLSYAGIEALLDGIAARKRLVLVDSCHAGESELVQPHAVESAAPAAAGIRAYRHTGPGRRRPRAPGLVDPALDDLFADLRRSAGAFVIAAAGAVEYAVESGEFHNGVFTHCVLQALQERAGSPEGGGILLVSDLQRQVSRRVSALTGGQQKPMARRENLRNDFSVI